MKRSAIVSAFALLVVQLGCGSSSPTDNGSGGAAGMTAGAGGSPTVIGGSGGTTATVDAAPPATGGAPLPVADAGAAVLDGSKETKPKPDTAPVGGAGGGTPTTPDGSATVPDAPRNDPPPDGGATGPLSCTVDNDCLAAGACPKDAALGCGCAPTPSGLKCVPRCSTDKDCNSSQVCSNKVCVGGGNPDGGPSSPPDGPRSAKDGGAGGPVMNSDNTVSDQAQSATIAFDGLAFVTGSFCAQTFYPPGKVADFFGFQYLRDNDPSNMGHNTDFTTLTADPILAMLSDSQVQTFVSLAKAEKTLADAYGRARFPLAKAFRRLYDGETPTGHPALDRTAVRAYSAYLFSIDGEMSYLRAQAYASVLGSMDATQKAVLDSMKGKGSLQWTQPTTEPLALKNNGAYSVELRTYAGEMLAWYVGGVDPDVYFCPERQGTYFGSFFMKDVKAMHNPSYTIDSNMTADMGDAFLATLDATTQRPKVTGLVTTQKADLLDILVKRTAISQKLRNFLSAGTVNKAEVLSLAQAYGELDGEISYFYATAFSGLALTAAQKTTLTALRKTATAETDGTPDYDTMCGNGYLYSAPMSTAPEITNTDFMFGVCAASGATCSRDWDCCSFSCSSGTCAAGASFTSSAFSANGALPMEYTCDGTGGMLSPNPPLAWSGAPTGTVEYALTMTTEALDGTKYNWVLFHIPASVTSLAKASTRGTAGVSTDGPDLRYYPPCSLGPGDKTYTFTLYALSAAPTFDVADNKVTGPILTKAIAGLTLATQQLNVTYARVGL